MDGSALRTSDHSPAAKPKAGFTYLFAKNEHDSFLRSIELLYLYVARKCLIYLTAKPEAECMAFVCSGSSVHSHAMSNETQEVFSHFSVHGVVRYALVFFEKGEFQCGCGPVRAVYIP
jgi:hypothetical protein